MKTYQKITWKDRKEFQPTHSLRQWASNKILMALSGAECVQNLCYCCNNNTLQSTVPSVLHWAGAVAHWGSSDMREEMEMEHLSACIRFKGI